MLSYCASLHLGFKFVTFKPMKIYHLRTSREESTVLYVLYFKQNTSLHTYHNKVGRSRLDGLIKFLLHLTVLLGMFKNKVLISHSIGLQKLH